MAWCEMTRNSFMRANGGANLCWALGGIICNFSPIFNIGGMNLDHHFFQVSKLSEDQKMEHFFPKFKWRPIKKKVFTKNETLYYPPIQMEICARMHIRVKLLEKMQMKTILKLLGELQSNYWGGIYPPIPPGFRHPCVRTKNSNAKHHFLDSIC